MAGNDLTLWGMHADRTGDADHIFLKKGYIAIGWAKMGDLSLLLPDREAFKAKYAEAYPDAKPAAIPPKPEVETKSIANPGLSTSATIECAEVRSGKDSIRPEAKGVGQ